MARATVQYHRALACVILILAFVSPAEAQTPKPVSEVIVAPFIVETDNADALRTQAASCSGELATALALKGVAVAREPELSENGPPITNVPFAIRASMNSACSSQPGCSRTPPLVHVGPARQTTTTRVGTALD